MANWKERSVYDWNDNLFSRINKDWMLVTAGNQEKCNTMTASWGGAGILWNKPVSFIFIRPQRYTLSFIEREPYYSLAFFGDGFRPALNFCGIKSGRDFDKWKETGLTPAFDLAPYPEEAEAVLVCRKLYRQDMAEDSFLDKGLFAANYPNKDLHRVFVGEIVKLMVKE